MTSDINHDIYCLISCKLYNIRKFAILRGIYFTIAKFAISRGIYSQLRNSQKWGRKNNIRSYDIRSLTGWPNKYGIYMSLLTIDMKTKVVQHVPSPKESNLTTWQPNNLTLLSIDMKTKVVQHDNYHDDYYVEIQQGTLTPTTWYLRPSRSPWL